MSNNAEAKVELSSVLEDAMGREEMGAIYELKRFKRIASGRSLPSKILLLVY
jgi:hypothetical protein